MSLFLRNSFSPQLPPPVSQSGVVAWMRTHLFSSPINTVLTFLGLYLGWQAFFALFDFAFVRAVWHGDSREACIGEVDIPAWLGFLYGSAKAEVGACWPYVGAKYNQLIYGLYPEHLYWRVNVVFVFAFLFLVPLLIPRVPYKMLNAILLVGLFPIFAFFMLVGGSFGLEYVETRLWGGLLVTLVVTSTGIITSLPLGILLALGRRSELPIVRALCTIFIEFWRGVPLITILFFATYMLPLFLPAQWTLDNLLRALVGVTLFASAYMAEIIRAGLQALPKGQYEGAKAMGLSYWQMMGLVVLPQALRIVIPGIVNNFLGLFKDTTLVLIVSIFDLLGQVRATFTDPNWATPVTIFTGFAFTGLIYWIFSYSLSRYSRFLENHLARGYKR